MLNHNPCDPDGYPIESSHTRLITAGHPDADTIPDEEKVILRVGGHDIADVPGLLQRNAYTQPHADSLEFTVRHLASSAASTYTIITSMQRDLAA